MKKSKISEIKRARRSSFLFSTLSSFLLQIIQDNPQLATFSLTRVDLSEKGSLCTLFFTCEGGSAEFQKNLSELVLFKPTLRHAISQTLDSRRCPELVFTYDHALDKARDLEAIFNALDPIEE